MPTSVYLSDTQEKCLLTAEEFLDWLEPGAQADLINGETCPHPPGSLRQADMLNFVHLLLAMWIGQRTDLGRVYREVMAVRFGSRNVFFPDLCFIPNKQALELRSFNVSFAPALVVETLSETNSRRGVTPKFTAYEEHGVLEYWILDSENLAHRFYKREGDFLIEYGQREELIPSGVVQGFSLRRSWLNPDQLPDPDACLKTIRASAKARADAEAFLSGGTSTASTGG